MFCRGFAVFGKIGGARILEFLELPFQGMEFSHPSRRHIEDGLFADGLSLLGEMADHGPFIPLDAASIRLVLFQDQREEGRFSGSVGSDKGNAFAVIDLHVGLFKKGASAKGFLEFANGEHGRSEK